MLQIESATVRNICTSNISCWRKLTDHIIIIRIIDGRNQLSGFVNNV